MTRAIQTLGKIGTQAPPTVESRRLERAARQVAQALHRFERIRAAEGRRPALRAVAAAVERLGTALLGRDVERATLRDFTYGVTLLLLRRLEEDLPGSVADGGEEA